MQAENRADHARLVGKRFAVSAIMSAFALVFGEQAALVLSSPVYFQTLGEWVWNVFVSTSFLLTIATLYGLAGGVCWQAMADHVDPWRRLLRFLRGNNNAPDDQRRASMLIAAIFGLTAYSASIFLVLLHTSSTYSNKNLAALLALVLMPVLAPVGIAVYALTKRIALHVTGWVERLIPGRVLKIELVLIFAAGLFGLLYFLNANSRILDVLDLRPLVIVAFFILAQMTVYSFLNSTLGREWTQSAGHFISLSGVVIIVATMLILTIIAYPSQARVAAVLRHHAPLTRPLLLLTQNLGDRDGDGFSSILRGGDCNDHNPAIHPMASDIPGNGIDEDCSGYDARPVKRDDRPVDELLALRLDSLKKPYNILVISIDALRADHMGLMGYARDTTPELDAFAKQSVVFTRAYAQAPNTPQSIPSVISGRYPSQIQWSHYTNFPAIKPETELVTEAFKRQGYRVAGVFPHWYFKRRNMERNADHWDTRAFRSRDHSERTYTDDLVADNAIAYLDEQRHSEQPLFMWVHFFDPHFLYVRHPGIDFGDGQMDLYDGEIRHSSQQVGRLIEHFKNSPFYRDSIIVVMADHGEEFGEHGRRWHGAQLYDESVRVPLIVHMPQLTPRRVDKPVSLVDLTPTLAEFAGVAFNGPQGYSLAPLMLGSTNAPLRPVYIEKLRAPTFPWSQQALVMGRWKLIHRVDEQVFELYDLTSDPHEARNLYDLLPEKADEMRMRLEDFRAQRLQEDGGWYHMAANQF